MDNRKRPAGVKAPQSASHAHGLRAAPVRRRVHLSRSVIHHQRSQVASKGRDLKTPLDYRSAARPTLGYANKGSVFAVTKRLGPPDAARVNLPSPHARARSARPQSRRARRRSSAASRPAAAGAPIRPCAGERFKRSAARRAIRPARTTAELIAAVQKPLAEPRAFMGTDREAGRAYQASEWRASLARDTPTDHNPCRAVSAL